MSFSNPIVGGNGTLVREKIQSENYIPGVSGWCIRRDGTFELDGGIFRGPVLVRDPSGAEIFIYGNGSETRIDLLPADQVGFGFDPGAISTTSGADGDTFMYLQSPQTFSPSASKIAQIALHSSFVGDTSFITLDAETLYGGPQSVPMGWGRIVGAEAIADSALVGAGETVVLTSPNQSFLANRAYEIRHSNRYTLAAATACFPVVLFRKANLAGQILHDKGRFALPASTNTFGYAMTSVFTVGVASVTTTIVMTLTGNGGISITQRGAAGFPRTFDIFDIGIASDFPNAPVLV